MKKSRAIGKFTIILLISLSFCAVSCGSSVKKKKSLTVKMPEYKEELTYFEAKKIALSAGQISSYNPFIISVECMRSGYRFMFYSIDLDMLFFIGVNHHTKKGDVYNVTENASKRELPFLSNIESCITAERALSVASSHAKLNLPMTPTGYTYRSWLSEDPDGEHIYKVHFGTRDKEYNYLVNAFKDGGKAMACDVTPRAK